MKCVCQACRNAYYSDDPLEGCPVCGSATVTRVKEKEGERDAAAGRPQYKNVVTDSKQSWREFHSTEQKACTQCGSTDFNLDFKHKEKVCKKCGNIMSLPRR